MCFCQKKIQECIDELEKEVLQIVQNPKSDKYEKNLLLKPLSSKKKILQNTIDSIKLVENQEKKD
ncbi:MAG: hypothetical protein ACQESH_02330 [Campylobacterota bacterium]